MSNINSQVFRREVPHNLNCGRPGYRPRETVRFSGIKAGAKPYQGQKRPAADEAVG